MVPTFYLEERVSDPGNHTILIPSECEMTAKEFVAPGSDHFGLQVLALS